MKAFSCFIFYLLKRFYLCLRNLFLNILVMEQEELEQKSDSNKPNNSKVKILIGAIILLIIALGVIAFILLRQKSEYNTQMEQNQEMIEFSKTQLQDQYQTIDSEYDNLMVNLKNDSLIHQLENEQAKVQRLMSELKSTKASNVAEINRLNKELSTLRNILKSYVAQIDSLNRLNQKLTAENQVITSKYNETNRALNQVSQEKSNLSEKVNLASKLDATNISVSATNSKGKAQKNIKKVEQLVVSFLITKNITAQPGVRDIYVRIMKPDDDVLIKSRANTFQYENSQINYSMKRQIEYGGEEMSVTLYWKVEEYLMPGTYRVDVFADGNRIGSKRFTLQD